MGRGRGLAGTFLEGLNLLSISAILGGDADEGLGSVRRSVCVQAAGERTREGGREAAATAAPAVNFHALSSERKSCMGNRVLLPFSSPSLSFTLAVPNANTNNIWHPHERTPFARPLANLQENCKAISAAAPPPLLFRSGTNIRNFTAVSFPRAACGAESERETLGVSVKCLGFTRNF